MEDYVILFDYVDCEGHASHGQRVCARFNQALCYALGKRAGGYDVTMFQGTRPIIF